MQQVPSPINQLTSPIKLQKDTLPSELLVKEMLSVKGIRTKTDLNDGLIVALTKGTIYAKIFKSKNMTDLVNLIAEYRVSRNRLGRTEMKDMIRSLSNPMEFDGKPTLSERLFKGNG